MENSDSSSFLDKTITNIAFEVNKEASGFREEIPLEVTTTLPNNYYRVNASAKNLCLFNILNRVSEIFEWKEPFETSFVYLVFLLFCFYPILIPFVPSLGLIGLIGYNYYLKKKNILLATAKPVPESNFQFFIFIILFFFLLLINQLL